jgi:Domain of unknown function (DUF5680)
MIPSLVQFVHAAKRATYAAEGDLASVTPLLAATKQLEYSDGSFLYRDLYAGMNFFVGQELVYESGRPVWSMAYAGGMTVDSTDAAVAAVYGVLRVALLQTPIALPLRGPGRLKKDQLEYACEVTGKFERFQGREVIRLAGSPVFELHFSGGALQ